MTLRTKTLLIISLTLVGLVVVLYALSSSILLGSFAQVEEQDTRRNVERALDAVAADLAALDSKTGDWANWDDAYTFVEDGNLDFIETNMVGVTFIQLRVNLSLFVHSSGRIVFSKAFDLQNEVEIPVPESIEEHLAARCPDDLLLRHADTKSRLTGIILLSEGPMLVASRPILTSEGQGPIRGTLIFGRYLDDAKIEHLAEITHLSLTGYRFDDGQMLPDFQEVRLSLSEGESLLVRPLSEQLIAGYALLRDIYGEPAFLLRVDIPRAIYGQGQATMGYLLLSLVAVGLVFGVATLVLLERLVLSRLARLSTDVSSIGTSGDHSARVLMTGRDELASLAGALNDMLQALEHSQHELRRAHDELEIRVEERTAELSQLYDLSRALADAAHDLDAILDLVTRRAVETIHVTFARVALLEGDDFALRAAYPIRVLGHDLGVSRREPAAAHPFCQRVLAQNATVVLHADSPEVSDYERQGLFLGFAQMLCLVPLYLGERALGLLMLGEARHEKREPFTPEKIRLANSIGDQAASALNRAELYIELERAYLQTVLALANAVDAKDTYTADHAQRLAAMALAVGREMGMSPRELEDLRYGAILHDIGKIGVPDAILQKPASLDADEWGRMHQHPPIGEHILAPVPRLAGAARLVRHHHERYDGTGYPDRLAGQAIPLGARILTVVDSYSAIIDKRTYKEARSPEEAVAELKRCAGTQFDPRVVEIFLQLLERGIDVESA